MKKIVVSGLVLALLLALAGCGAKPSFDGIITEIHEDRISLYIEEGQELREMTDVIEINPQGLKDIGAEIGDRVTITYTGQVMMSLPPQVSVVRWKISEKGVGVPETSSSDMIPAYDPETME